MLPIGPDGPETLEREIELCASLKHPAVPQAVELFRWQQSQVVVFEHVDGIRLSRLLPHLERDGERLSDGAIWYLGLQSVGALARAHAATDAQGKPAPVIHGRLAPQHVLIAWDGRVLLMGLGLPTLLAAEAKAASTEGALLEYAAPELKDGRKLTPAADVYAAALMIWSLLTGRAPPAGGERVPLLSEVRRDIPESVGAAIDLSLDPAPGLRQVRCVDLERELRRVANVAVGKAELRDSVEIIRALLGLWSVAPPPTEAAPAASPGPPPIALPPPALGGARPPTLREPRSQPPNAPPSSVPPRPARRAAIDQRVPGHGAPPAEEPPHDDAEPARVSAGPPPLPPTPAPTSAAATTLRATTPSAPATAPTAADQSPPPAATTPAAPVAKAAPPVTNVAPRVAAPTPETTTPSAPPGAAGPAVRTPVPPAATPAGPAPEASSEARDPAPAVAGDRGAIAAAAPAAAPSPPKRRRSRALTPAIALGFAAVAGAWVAWDAGLLGPADTVPTTATVAPAPCAAPPASDSRQAVPSAASAAAAPDAALSATSSQDAGPAATASSSAVPPPGDAAAPSGDGSELLSYEGYLIVRSSAKAEVFVQGKHLGPTNTRLLSRCHQKFIRIGTLPGPKWLSSGIGVSIGCRTTTEVTIEPEP